jgi:hypothetical protein
MSSSDSMRVSSSSRGAGARARSTNARGANDPRFRLEERRPAARHADRPAPARFEGIEQLVLGCSRFESILRALSRILDELEESVQLEQLLARLLLQLVPAREGLFRQLHELDLGICEPHDPRAAMARAARVTDAELLENNDVVPVPRERARGRTAHDPRADDRNVHLHILAT